MEYTAASRTISSCPACMRPCNSTHYPVTVQGIWGACFDILEELAQDLKDLDVNEGTVLQAWL